MRSKTSAKKRKSTAQLAFSPRLNSSSRTNASHSLPTSPGRNPITACHSFDATYTRNAHESPTYSAFQEPYGHIGYVYTPSGAASFEGWPAQPEMGQSPRVSWHAPPYHSSNAPPPPPLFQPHPSHLHRPGPESWHPRQEATQHAPWPPVPSSFHRSPPESKFQNIRTVSGEGRGISVPDLDNKRDVFRSREINLSPRGPSWSTDGHGKPLLICRTSSADDFMPPASPCRSKQKSRTACKELVASPHRNSGPASELTIPQRLESPSTSSVTVSMTETDGTDEVDVREVKSARVSDSSLQPNTQKSGSSLSGQEISKIEKRPSDNEEESLKGSVCLPKWENGQPDEDDRSNGSLSFSPLPFDQEPDDAWLDLSSSNLLQLPLVPLEAPENVLS